VFGSGSPTELMVVDGQAWVHASEEREREMTEVYRRLADRGIVLGSGDDAATLTDAIEDRSSDTSAFVTAGGQGGFYVWVDEWQAFAADAYGWSPIVALARAIDKFLAEDETRAEMIKRR